MAKNSKRTSTLRKRGDNRTETKADALSRGMGRLSVSPMPAMVIVRPRGHQATVEVIDTRGRATIEGTSLMFTDPDSAMAFLAIT